jgi:hypothetical protein
MTLDINQSINQVNTFSQITVCHFVTLYFIYHLSPHNEFLLDRSEYIGLERVNTYDSKQTYSPLEMLQIIGNVKGQ